MTAVASSGGADPQTFSLTPRAYDLLSFIRQWTAEHGSAPGYKQMAAAIGVKSKHSVYRLLGQLQERGLIRRIPRAKHSVVVIEPGATITIPDDVDGILRAAAKSFGRTPSEHAAAVIRANCPPLQPF